MHLLLRGTNKTRVQGNANLLTRAVLFMGICELVPTDIDSIRRVSQKWISDKDLHTRKPVGDQLQREFFNAVLNWFRFHGMLISSPQPSQPYGSVLPDLLSYLKGTKGLSAETISTHGERLRQFLDWASFRIADLSMINLSVVERYLEFKRLGGLKPRSICALCQSLRIFFRYADTHGLTESGIAAGIHSPCVPRYDPGPKGPTWSDVKRLTARRPESSRADIRARAMLLLFAVCGLRSGEVSNLLLSDLDWREETFLVRRLKRGRVQRLPLPYEVGEAILEYLRQARRTSSSRHLFVTLNPPYHQVISIGTVVETRMKRLKISSPHYGPHALRHSCATQLLHKGSSLKEIADFLGHRNTESVGIYAKSSASAIRKVAAFQLDGLL